MASYSIHSDVDSVECSMIEKGGASTISRATAAGGTLGSPRPATRQLCELKSASHQQGGVAPCHAGATTAAVATKNNMYFDSSVHDDCDGRSGEAGEIHLKK